MEPILKKYELTLQKNLLMTIRCLKLEDSHRTIRYCGFYLENLDLMIKYENFLMFHTEHQEFSYTYFGLFNYSYEPFILVSLHQENF